jgi:T-complex protein 1 subunit beta
MVADNPGFILDKRIGVNQPKRLEKAKILVANTPMDTDKVKVFGARVRVDATGKLAELERAEKVSSLLSFMHKLISRKK